jgi:cysteinyl-tRNA synthetase
VLPNFSSFPPISTTYVSLTHTLLNQYKGHLVTDPKIYRDFAAYWEEDYFRDMDRIKVRRPDILTRVSEYIPEIVTFVQKIIANGFAYELNGSIYFDTVKFNNAPGHYYAKLAPWSASDVKLAQEG